jgi:hypothetical protein
LVGSHPTGSPATSPTPSPRLGDQITHLDRPRSWRLDPTRLRPHHRTHTQPRLDNDHDPVTRVHRPGVSLGSAMEVCAAPGDQLVHFPLVQLTHTRMVERHAQARIGETPQP